MTLLLVLGALALHWFADFVVQTDAMAKGKSSSNRTLAEHVLTYGMTLLLGSLLLGTCLYIAGMEIPSPGRWIGWALLNAALHWPVDFVTSRASKHCFDGGRVHEGFVVIGFDQLVHTSLLIATLPGGPW